MDKIKILIAEDEVISAEDLALQLKSLGYDVLGVVTSGTEAIEETKMKRPHLVLMDIKLKGKIDGIDAADQIHTQFQIPVVYITALADKDSLERIKKTAPSGYILKPIDEKELHCVIQTAVYKNQIETELRKSEERYRTLLSNLNVAVFRTTPEGKIISVNPTVLKILGCRSGEDLLNTSVFPFYCSKKDRDTLIQKIDRQGSVSNFEVQIKRKDGMKIWVSLNIQAIRDEKGNCIYLDGIGQDITERKQVEKALQESEKKYRIIVDQSLEGIIILQGFHFVFANNAFAELSGYAVEELLCLSPEQVQAMVHPDDQALVWGRFRDRLGGKSVPSRYAYRGIRKDGKTIWLEMSSTRIEYQGEPAVQAGILDITERKLAEEQFQKDLKEKEILLKEIHHRVKNNLQVISSLLRLQADRVTEKQIHDMFRECQDRVLSMSLVHETLYKSKDMARIDFADYVRRLAGGLYKSYISDAKKIALDIRIQDVPVGINMAVPCGLILNELITNAIKHAFPPSYKGRGRLFVSMKKTEDNKIKMIVKDNGVGIPNAMDIRKTKSLGLKLVAILAEDQLGGKITLDRRNGTKFQILFKEEKSNENPLAEEIREASISEVSSIH